MSGANVPGEYALKQAAQQQYSAAQQQYSAPPSPSYSGDVAQPQTLFEAACQQTADIGRVLAESVGRLSALRDRVFGPEPPGPAAGQNVASKTSAAAYTLGIEIERSAMLAQHLARLVTDLERIA